MNLISWTTRPVFITESTINYIPVNLIEESIAKTLKPVMNKMQKLNIGLPYRDARLFFFNFLKDKYPDVIPAGFETRKPSAKDVNAIVGTIAIERPELLDAVGTEFEAYSKETVPGGMDRVSQFLNIAATLRQGKGVRPKKAEGYVVKDYSKLTAQEIADATTDAIERTKRQRDTDDDVSDEKLLLRTAAGVVISQLREEDIPDEALDNVSDAVAKINSLSQFEKFLDYIANMEEYSVIHQYLVDVVKIVKSNLTGMPDRTAVEDEEGNIYDNMRYDSREYPANSRDEFDDEDLSELSILTPDQYERAMMTVDGFNPDEWGFSKIQDIYFKIRAGGENEEGCSGRRASKREEAEEVKMSPYEMNNYLAAQERNRVQHLYAQQRRYTHGY
jgi:hypothetical protein